MGSGSPTTPKVLTCRVPKMSTTPTEDEIRTRLFESFEALHPHDVIVEKWSGYSVKTGKERERKYLLREIDIARFSRIAIPELTRAIFGGVSYNIRLYAYEVKGYTKMKDGGFSEPTFGNGIDQAIANLYQGADLSYVVYPETHEETRNNLIKMCETFAPRVDLIFMSKEGMFIPWKNHREPLTHVSPQDTKRRMLSTLIASGSYSRIQLPDWAKNHQY